MCLDFIILYNIYIKNCIIPTIYAFVYHSKIKIGTYLNGGS